MWRLIKFVVILALLVGAAGAISFAGAFMKMKDYLGPNLPPLGPRTSTFIPRAENLDDKPVWQFQYSNTQMQGLQAFTVFVSPTGNIVATIPPNLNTRLERYRRQMP